MLSCCDDSWQTELVIIDAESGVKMCVMILDDQSLVLLMQKLESSVYDGSWRTELGIFDAESGV